MSWKQEYEGHTVTVNSYGRFEISGPLFENDNVMLDTYEKARQRIDDRISRDKAAKKIKVSFPVLNERGEKALVTGLHATRNILTGSNLKDAGWVYPPVDLVAELLRKVEQHKRDLLQLDGELKSYRVDSNRRSHYGPDNPEARMKTFEAELVEKTKKAEAAAKKESK